MFNRPHEQSEQGDGGDKGDARTQETIDALRAENDDLRAKYQRALADYQNAQRRAAAEIASAREYAAVRTAESLLPVLDNFELALQTGADPAASSPFAHGIRMIHDELRRALETSGLRAIRPAPGEAFDPAIHQAVCQQDVPTVPPGGIVAVMQVGYALGQRVVRAAKVSIRPACGEPDPCGTDSPGSPC